MGVAYVCTIYIRVYKASQKGGLVNPGLIHMYLHNLRVGLLVETL